MAQKIATAILEIRTDTGQIKSGLSEVVSQSKAASAALASLGKFLAGAAVVAFGREMLDAADALTKLSDRTGIGVVALQRLGAVAEASGNTVEQVAAAVNAFQKRLTEGGKGTAAALDRIGLSVQELRALSPDEQFFAIANAIQGIKDPAEQTRVAMELFGKAGAELLPTLKANVDELKDSTVKMSAEAVAALDDFGDAMSRLTTSGTNALGNFLGELMRVGNEWNRFSLNLQSGGALEQRVQQLGALNQAMKGAPALSGAAALSMSPIELDDAMKLLGSGLKEQLAIAERAAAAAKKAAGDYKRWAEEVAQVRERVDELNRANAAPLFREVYDPASGDLPDVAMLGEYLSHLEKVRDVEQSIARNGATGLAQLGRELEVAVPKARTLTDSLRSLAGLDFRSAFRDLGQFLKGGLGQVGTGFLRGIGNAVMGGVAGLLSSGVNVLAKGLGKLLGGLFGNNEEKKINPVRQAYIDAAGGLAALNQRAMEATGSLELVRRLLDAKNAAEYERAIRDLDAAFEGYNTLLDQVTDGMGDLESAVADAGGRIPSHLRPMVEQLLQIGNLTDEQRRKLQGLLDAGPDFKALERTAAEFGISLDALGPQFQQAHVSDEGMRILGVFEQLEDAGADIGGVLLGMSDEVSALVQQAIRYGSALPEGLKPILENLSAAGKLTDENGNKIEDLSGLSFKETPLDKSSQAIVDAIDKLRELFERLPGVAQASADGISRALDGIEGPQITGRVHWELDPMPGVPEIDRSFRVTGGIPMARGGYGRVTQATPFILGEAGTEDFVAGGAGRNLAQDVARELAGIMPTAGGGRASIELVNHNVVNLDGQRVAENTVRRIVLGKRGLDVALRDKLVPVP